MTDYRDIYYRKSSYKIEFIAFVCLLLLFTNPTTKECNNCTFRYNHSDRLHHSLEFENIIIFKRTLISNKIPMYLRNSRN